MTTETFTKAATAISQQAYFNLWHAIETKNTSLLEETMGWNFREKLADKFPPPRLTVALINAPEFVALFPVFADGILKNFRGNGIEDYYLKFLGEVQSKVEAESPLKIESLRRSLQLEDWSAAKDRKFDAAEIFTGIMQDPNAHYDDTYINRSRDGDTFKSFDEVKANIGNTPYGKFYLESAQNFADLIKSMIASKHDAKTADFLLNKHEMSEPFASWNWAWDYAMNQSADDLDVVLENLLYNNHYELAAKFADFCIVHGYGGDEFYKESVTILLNAARDLPLMGTTRDYAVQNALNACGRFAGDKEMIGKIHATFISALEDQYFHTPDARCEYYLKVKEMMDKSGPTIAGFDQILENALRYVSPGNALIYESGNHPEFATPLMVELYKKLPQEDEKEVSSKYSHTMALSRKYRQDWHNNLLLRQEMHNFLESSFEKMTVQQVAALCEQLSIGEDWETKEWIKNIYKGVKEGLHAAKTVGAPTSIAEIMQRAKGMAAPATDTGPATPANQ